jgi:hypothetical protein
MGRRYASVCNSLKIPFIGVDKNDKLPKDITHVILATPTDSHLIDIIKLRLKYPYHVKVLCEKPISKIKHPNDLDVLKDKVHEYFMVNQYAYYRDNIDETHNDGVTSYNYYNSGKDGNLWDCIQLIQLAKGAIKIRNNLPIWTCRINGFSLSRELIDHCYVKMIQDFTTDYTMYRRPWGIDTIIDAHEKVLRYEAGLNSNPS